MLIRTLYWITLAFTVHINYRDWCNRANFQDRQAYQVCLKKEPECVKNPPQAPIWWISGYPGDEKTKLTCWSLQAPDWK